MNKVSQIFRVKMPLRQLDETAILAVESAGINRLISIDHMPHDPYFADAFISKDGRQIVIGVQGETAYSLNLNEVIEIVIQLHKLEREATGLEPPVRSYYVNKLGYLLKNRIQQLYDSR